LYGRALIGSQVSGCVVGILVRPIEACCVTRIIGNRVELITGIVIDNLVYGIALLLGAVKVLDVAVGVVILAGGYVLGYFVTFASSKD
jgi:hypothetical protein